MEKRALLVQEPGFVRIHMQKTLNNAGFKVYEVENGRHILRGHFDDVQLADLDVVLLDVDLPDIEGDELIKFINKKAPSLPVIVVSIEKTRDRIIQLIDMGAWDFLVKPVESQFLIRRINRHLEKAAQKTDQTSVEPLESRTTGGTRNSKEMQKAKETRESKKISSKGGSRAPTSKTELTPQENWMAMRDQVTEEIDRSIRTQSSLTILKVTGNPQELKELVSAAEITLRRIDAVYYLEDAAALVLPATKVEGVAVVKEKLMNVFNEITMEGAPDVPDLQFHELRFLHEDYPEEVNTYRVEDIAEDMLNRFQSISSQ